MSKDLFTEEVIFSLLVNNSQMKSSKISSLDLPLENKVVLRLVDALILPVEFAAIFLLCAPISILS